MQRHRKANAFPDLGTPGDPRLLAAIERRTPGIAGGGINHFFGGTVITQRNKLGKSQWLPFDVELFSSTDSGETTWKVRVHPGRVNERIPGAGEEQTIPHEPGNLYEEIPDPPPSPLPPQKLSEFPVVAGDGVFISVSVDANGMVVAPEGDEELKPVNIEIASADPGPASTHYVPKVDDGTPDGAPGGYKYKLAEIELADDGALKLKRFLAGSHISHFQELPSVRTTIAAGEGIGVIPQKWDNDAKCYKLRAISKGLGKLGVTTNADEVEVRGNKIGNEFAVFKGDTEDSLGRWEFRDGLLETGTEIVGDEDPPVEIDPPLEICIPIVEPRASTIESPAQITVTETGAKSSTYIVEGNGINTYLEFTNDGTPVARLNFIDGLLSEEVGATVEIGGLPEGSRGDVMVHDGTGWVALASPGAPTSPNRNFFVHDGDMPAWLELEAKEIQICDGGTPVTKTIYVEP